MGNNWAIVIGINEYEHHEEQNLLYAVRDAQAIKNFLCDQAGFEEKKVVLCLGERSNQTSETYPSYPKLIRWLTRELQPNQIGAVDRLWFFFCGHGINQDGTDYLVPCDSLQEDSGLMIPVPKVIDALSYHQNADIVLILDNCRTQAGKRSTNVFSYGEETLAMAQSRGIVMLFACDRGQAAYELDQKQQGAFTLALLEGLEHHTLPLQLEVYLQRRVGELLRESGIGEQQTPKISLDSSLHTLLPLLPEVCMTEADLSVLKQRAFAAELVAKSVPEFQEIEQLWWRIIQVSRSSLLFAEARESILRIREKNVYLRLEAEFEQKLQKLNQELQEAKQESGANQKATQKYRQMLKDDARASVQSELNQLQQKEQRTRQNLQNLEQKQRTLLQQNAEQQRLLSQLGQDKSILDAQLQTSKQEYQRLVQERDGLRQQLEAKKAEYQRQLKNQEYQYQGQVSQLQKQITDLENSLVQVPPKAKAKSPKSNSFFGFTRSQPEPPQQEVALQSEKGVNYGRLRDWLSKGNWQEADQETTDRMLEAMGKERWWDVKLGDLLNFPCEDLRTIDDLWVHYSQGKFGFSVQKQIYLDCGAKLDGKYSGNKIWYEFGERVEWRVDGKWLLWTELTFTLKAPGGHLPWVGGVCDIVFGDKLVYLLSRTKTCEA